MRTFSFVLCSVLSLSSLTFGQQPSDKPQKERPPEQQTQRPGMKEFWEKQKSLLAQAKRVFDAGMAGKKSGDCFREKSTYAGDVCLEEAVQTAEENLKLYDDAIRGLLVLKYPGEDDDDKGPVPEPTGEQLAAEFDRLEKVWRKYLELATESELHQFGNGTAAAGEALACHLMLVRSHMRELDGMYHTMLHK